MHPVLPRKCGVLALLPASWREPWRSCASSASTISTAKVTPLAPCWTGCRRLPRAQTAGGDPLWCKVGLPLAKAPDARHPLRRRWLSHRLRRDYGSRQPPPGQELAAEHLRANPSLRWHGREAGSREKSHSVRATHRPAYLRSIPVAEREAPRPAHHKRPQEDSGPTSGRSGLSADEDDAWPDLGPRPEARAL